MVSLVQAENNQESLFLSYSENIHFQLRQLSVNRELFDAEKQFFIIHIFTIRLFSLEKPEHFGNYKVSAKEIHCRIR